MCFFVQGALSLKRTIDDTVGLHGGIYRSCCDGCVYQEGHPVSAEHETQAVFFDAILYYPRPETGRFTKTGSGQT